MTEQATLTAILTEQYQLLDDQQVVAISPSALATAVYAVLDPEHLAPVLVEYAAYLELKQLARAVCRRQHYDESEQVEQQTNLFEYHLQARYPCDRNNEQVYVLLDHLTLEEGRKNQERLRKEAEAKTAHSDALGAFLDYKFSAVTAQTETNA